MTNKTKTYDAGDMHNLASLAESDLDWMSTAITDIRIRITKIKDDLTARDIDAQYHFHTLERVLGMYEYLAEDRARCYEGHSKEYKTEWESSKQKASA